MEQIWGHWEIWAIQDCNGFVKQQKKNNPKPITIREVSKTDEWSKI
jgi:hypothetical protein